MREFIIKKVLLNKPIISYLIIFSPILIGLGLFFIEPMITTGFLFNYPLVIYFFPFPFLLFLIIWMDTVYYAVRPKINCETGLKDRRFTKLITVSKWTLLFLSIMTWCSELIVFIDFENLNSLIKIILNIIWAIGSILMLVSYYTYYYASKFIGKLILVAENQKPFDKKGNYYIGLPSLMGLLPNVYSKAHNRIKKIVNE